MSEDIDVLGSIVAGGGGVPACEESAEDRPERIMTDIPKQ